MSRIAMTMWLLALSADATPATDLVEGFTEPYRKIEVAPAEAGVLVKLAVREGESVRRGQLLGTLDRELLLVALRIATLQKEARGELDTATAEVEARKHRLDKLTPLRAAGHASQEEVDRARADLAIAQAHLLKIKEQLAMQAVECEKIQTMIERRNVRSPLDGVVLKLHREEGEYVSLSAPTVATVVQLDPLLVTFGLPTRHARRMRVGDRATILLVDENTPAEAEIESISPVTEAESGTVRVKIRLANGDGKLRAGLRCGLRLTTPVSAAANSSQTP
jgi:RND family efflux transporter MFP subunit